MIADLVLILAGLLVLAGSAFAAIAALGILRLPDVYNRMHSASKAGAVGAGMLLLALALTSDSTPATLRALAAVAFILLTAPLAAHLLAKAAYSVGYKLGPESVLNEMPEPMERTSASDLAVYSGEDGHAGEFTQRPKRQKRVRPKFRWSEMKRP